MVIHDTFFFCPYYIFVEHIICIDCFWHPHRTLLYVKLKSFGLNYFHLIFIVPIPQRNIYCFNNDGIRKYFLMWEKENGTERDRMKKKLKSQLLFFILKLYCGWLTKILDLCRNYDELLKILFVVLWYMYLQWTKMFLVQDCEHIHENCIQNNLLDESSYILRQ